MKAKRTPTPAAPPKPAPPPQPSNGLLTRLELDDFTSGLYDLLEAIARRDETIAQLTKQRDDYDRQLEVANDRIEQLEADAEARDSAWAKVTCRMCHADFWTTHPEQRDCSPDCERGILPRREVTPCQHSQPA
jgi:hypothetical protein